MTDKEKVILDYLDGKLLGMAGNYPIVYKKMLESINTKRGGNTLDSDGRVTNKPWSDELLAEIDKRLTKYEESLDE